MQVSNVKRVYFIGIGGIGMSALARYFMSKGCAVSGYDRTETELTKQLQQAGITIHFQDDITQADTNADLVIYTPAVPPQHAELNFFIDNGFTVMKRSKVLGELSKDKFTIAVAGSHGKTTVSSMIAWILKDSGYDCTAFLGGICSNFNSNFVAGDNDVMVIEADEFDRSFLQLSPNIAVITAVDSDHLEIYGTQAELEKTFTEFANKIKPGGALIAKSSLPFLSEVVEQVITYSLNDTKAHTYAAGYSLKGDKSIVTLNNGISYSLQYPGYHNIENSAAAATVCLHLGIAAEKITAALSAFKGIHRRFEKIFTSEKCVFIDDYAHHPEEIRMFLLSMKDIYAGRKITAVFQPHLFSRTKDLSEGFAQSLDMADEIILLPIYPARELPIEGVTSQLLLDKMHNTAKHLLSKEALLNYVKEKPIDVLCTIGAGDIDLLVTPIATILNQRYSA